MSRHILSILFSGLINQISFPCRERSAGYGQFCRGGGEHPEPVSLPGEGGEISAQQPRPASQVQLQAEADHRAPAVSRSVSVRGCEERKVQSQRLALRLTLRLPLLLTQDKEEATEGEEEGRAGLTVFSLNTHF